MFSKPKKLTSSHIKSQVSLSHIKTRYDYEFPLYLPNKFLINFMSVHAIPLC